MDLSLFSADANQKRKTKCWPLNFFYRWEALLFVGLWSLGLGEFIGYIQANRIGAEFLSTIKERLMVRERDRFNLFSNDLKPVNIIYPAGTCHFPATLFLPG